MNAPIFQLPPALGKLLSKLPAYPGSLLLAGGINLVLRKHLPAETLALLENRPLRIQVKDAGIAFDFVCRRGAFSPLPGRGDVDLTIGATAYDFYLLSQRREDPDTLFFSRRLTMEGDTELGLLVKNSLDAIDLSVFALEQWLPARLFRQRPIERGGMSG
ncbi:ubiquinone anaerobic biosynthesis accessory factor UbiT [Burkholderia oklahomensis]|uniref:ubiquinone anaerobic biosynthesis accessory factor UbiT n=1 Tax=Burkholderia oklahomensis TaxID=342113 RepID=UPI00016A8D67|nr:SCP2 sterol-binding domain-containing protein [Burkholderia oklahomensis]AJX30890.1 SCP-2 sterol transfer family protein [Burkholderia oklahomensis C6786]AOI45419.1 sterol-binding protein [Burkholderia oklahomensis C6786]KUY63664.1 sterol-binding protein [Burkholderia oklahomensis C6786]MBI0358501.1 SCP2 sterol-binding domain-containing protein [Burkholderia oklahomensis]SUW56682.1 Putative lipid carrier protein [Burkholderia oklahomensis]